MLAVIANEDVPDGCRRHNRFQAPSHTVSYYWSPGSPILTGKKESSRFIRFYYNNTGPGDRTPWKKLTGEQQFEWIVAWINCDKTDEARPQGTLGLAGTDIIHTIADEGALRAAVAISPSLRNRRPQGHAISQEDWVNPRQLWPDA